jgi:hypothetical protein
MEFLNNYIVLVVMGVCLCAGFVIKKLIPTDKINKFIPLIMAALGVFINVWVNEFSISPEILLAGLASGLASTGLYETFAQFLKAFTKK